jgi:hypothetical protein
LTFKTADDVDKLEDSERNIKFVTKENARDLEDCTSENEAMMPEENKKLWLETLQFNEESDDHEETAQSLDPKDKRDEKPNRPNPLPCNGK